LDDCHALHINLDTLGVTNGCLDVLYEVPLNMQLANNNTYGLKTVPDDIFEEASHNVTKPGGCSDLIVSCREAQALGDPDNRGTNSTVNEICATAIGFCQTYVEGAYVQYSGVCVPLCVSSAEEVV
jgi:hypothetical protein